MYKIKQLTDEMRTKKLKAAASTTSARVNAAQVLKEPETYQGPRECATISISDFKNKSDC
jgi:hypothetical protein